MARAGHVDLIDAGMKALLDDIADSECKPAAEAGAARARASAPTSGAYRDSIRVWSEQNPSRKVWRYGSDLDYAAIVEADHGTLARSL